MRSRASRLTGVIALVATTGIAAAAFQVDPDIVSQVSTPQTTLWVPAPATGEIVRIDVASHDVTARVVVGEPGAEFEIEERDNGVVVVDRRAGRVVLVDPALDEVTREVRSVAAGDGPVDIGPEAIVIGSESEVAVVDLDIAGARTTSVPGPVRSAAADGTGAAAENGTAQVSVDAQGTTSAPVRSTGMLVRVLDEVVVVGADGVEGRDGRQLACFESPVDGPDHVIGTSDNWVVAVQDRDVHVADLSNGTCAVVALGEDVGPLGRPVVAGRRVYVPEPDTGVVHIIEPSRGVVKSHVVFPPGDSPLDVHLRSRGDVVVAYDAGGGLAAFLDPGGVVEALFDTSGLVVAGRGDDESAPVVDEEDEVAGSPTEGVDEASTSTDAPALDAGVLAISLRNSTDIEDPLPNDDLVANFSFSASTVAVGDSVRFVDGSTGSPEAWLWDFGDGTGAEGPEVLKSWGEPGTYPVTLRVIRGEESAEISLAITVVPDDASLPPAADFVFSSTVVSVGVSVDFEDRSDGRIDRWRWDFGDGTTSTARNVRKAWDAPGRYTVQLTVANEQGSDSSAIVVEVVDDLRPPVAVITVADREVALGAPLRFRASSSTDPASFRWNFGDGTTSTGPDVIHVFLAQGTFRVRLTAENSAGSSTKVVEITVTAPTKPPIAAMAALPPLIEVGQMVSLASLSTNAPDLESWSFGDGGSASGRRVTHTWTSPGRYLITLTATNPAGTASVTAAVQIVAELPEPVARIGSFDASPWVGEPTAFSDASIGATGWLWDFGDGVTSNAANSLHTFTSPGSKIVRLTVSNRNGSDTTTVVVEPRLRPIAAFDASTNALRAGGDVVFTDASVNASRWFWNFGDGTTSVVQNPTHTFAVPGTYPVTLTIESSTGDTDTSPTLVITVDPAGPALSGIGRVPIDGGTITTLSVATFEAQVAPSSGPIDLYEIDFGDGSDSVFGASPRFSHVYGSAGEPVVRMRARGPLGDWSLWVSRTFSVVDPAPPSVAIADEVPSSAEVGRLTLIGVELVNSGPINTWRWEVTHNGTTWNYTGQSASHDFSSAGVYNIRLIAEGPVAQRFVEQDITITTPPGPSITSLIANPSPATTGVVVGFSAAVTGSVTDWEWNYEGEGFVSGGPSGAHIFNVAGPRTVVLRVTGPYGDQDVMSVVVDVDPRPAPTQPVASPGNTIETGMTVNLSSSDAGGRSGLRWDWKIARGAEVIGYLDAGQSIDHRFDDAGSWTVTVTATDSLGISGSAVLFVEVVDPVPLVASFTDVAAGGFDVQFTDTSGPYSIDSWSWDFGDPSALGNPSEANPLVTYPGPGTYTVVLRVMSGSRSDSFTRAVTVS